MTFPLVRGMRIDDLAGVLAVQAACYGEALLEPAGVMRQRLAVAGDSCWVAQAAQGVVGYLLCYRSLPACVTALHGEFHPAPQADTLYLHDLAVHPRAAGQGMGLRLFECARQLAQAERLTGMALVSVQQSAPFWVRQGFAPVELAPPGERARLAAYGTDAAYMVRAA
jgi:ribosomal protein S18 acetylase RimI-like enzyme